MTSVLSFRVINCPLANNYIWLFVHASNEKLNANHCSCASFLRQPDVLSIRGYEIKILILNKPVYENQTVEFYVKQLYILRLPVIQIIRWTIPTH